MNLLLSWGLVILVIGLALFIAAIILLFENNQSSYTWILLILGITLIVISLVMIAIGYNASANKDQKESKIPPTDYYTIVTTGAQTPLLF